MTEAEWLACNDPKPMLEFLRDKASHRKANLFLCAMCRLNWHLLYDDVSKENVAVVERFLDGQATEEELRHSRYFAECPTFGFDFSPGIWRTWAKPGEIPDSVQKLVEMGVFSEKELQEDEPVVDPVIRARLQAAAGLAEHAGCSEPLGESYLLHKLAKLDGPSTAVLRCIFGPLPFRQITVCPAWQTTNVVSIANGIYVDRRFTDLPVLADALEDVGCGNRDILDHCRDNSTEHALGCWVLDLLLGKS